MANPARRAALALLLLGLGLTACGYHNPYVARGDAKAIKLYRPLWVNRTTELGLESLLARELSTWLHKNRQLTLNAEAAEGTDYTLQGTIVGVATPELSYGLFNRANELALQVTVNCAVSDNRSGKVLWERKNYTLSEAFAVGTSSMDSLTMKKLALAKIANRLAEEIHLQLLNTVMRPPAAANPSN